MTEPKENSQLFLFADVENVLELPMFTHLDLGRMTQKNAVETKPQGEKDNG